MIDVHAHITFPEYDDDRADVVERARRAGVTSIIDVGTTIPASKKAVAYAAEMPDIYATVGVHPHDAGTWTENQRAELHALAEEHRGDVVAIGEIGLDYSRKDTKKDAQVQCLSDQLRVAATLDLPVMFHVRDAHDDLIYILQSRDRPRGVIHTFSGTKEQAKMYLDLGLFLSFSGVVTFPSAADVHETVKIVPLDRLLVETDCPFLTPVPHRGKRNEPGYVRYVVETIAEIRGMRVEEVERVTDENARAVFGCNTKKR